MQRTGSPPPIVQHLSPRLSLICCLPQTWSSSPSFCPSRATLRCIFLLSHPFSMSLSLCLSPPPPLFSSSDAPPSSLPCLLQQKIQHRHQHVFLCMPLYDGSAGKPHMLMKNEKVIKKKKNLMHVCQMLWSKHGLLKVTSQLCKPTPWNH